MARDDRESNSMKGEVSDLTALLRTLDEPVEGRIMRNGYSQLSDFIQKRAGSRR